MINILREVLHTLAQAVAIWASRSNAADPARDSTFRAW